MKLTSGTGESLEILLHIDEAKAPLAHGQEIRGRIIAMLPLSRPPLDRGAILQPENDTQPSFGGLTLFVSPRDRRETWNDFRAGHSITVFVSLLDSRDKEVAAGIGSLRLVA